MRLQNRLRELEHELDNVDRPVVRIYHKDGIVWLTDGREMTIDEYKRLVASGEIGEFRKEVLVKKYIIRNTIILRNGPGR